MSPNAHGMVVPEMQSLSKGNAPSLESAQGTCRNHKSGNFWSPGVTNSCVCEREEKSFTLDPQAGDGRVERATTQSTNNTTKCPHAYAHLVQTSGTLGLSQFLWHESKVPDFTVLSGSMEDCQQDRYILR